MKRLALLLSLAVAVGATLLVVASPADASHSWGNYHWARMSNPFTLKLGDNVTGAWDAYLGVASSDWTRSTVLDTTVVAGSTTGRKCRATSGRVEVCNASYGFNGWLGVAQIWISGSHITQGTVKVNDSYFNTATYNTPAWRQMVMCQEIGHTFGLDHQDETFNNANLGTCMDYTNNPGTNQHPNQHDYDQLATIYSHLDSTTTIKDSVNTKPGNGNGADLSDPSAWGRLVASYNGGRTEVYERDLGGGEKLYSFVIWADRGNPNPGPN